MLTRAQFEHIQAQARILAMQVGLEATSRAMNIDYARLRKWASRGKWNIQAYRGNYGHLAHTRSPNTSQSHEFTNGVEALHSIMGIMSDRTQLALAKTAMKAGEHLADCEPHKLVAPAYAIAAEQYSRTGDRVHGWSSARTQPQVTNIAVVLPTPEERARTDALHASLDAIAKRLSDTGDT